MRIISGIFKGRKFYPPAKNWPTRPTTDFAKEGLFNILMNRLDFTKVKMLDLFGGTGNHCYEFISRGGDNVTYVDKFGPAVQFVREVSTQLDVSEKVKIVKLDVFKFIKTCREKYDYIFAGPPYPLPTLSKIPDEIFTNGLLADDGIFVLEHDLSHNFEQHPNYVESRSYGLAVFSFFENIPA